MRILVGLGCAALCLLYVGQIVSVVNFGLAQRLGLQEKPDRADPLFGRLELWAARWDLLSLWILPVAGVLMVFDHPWWPYAAMIGGGTCVDTGGREAAKVLGLRQERVRTGAPGEFRLALGAYFFLMAIGGLAIVTGLLEAT